MLGWRGWRVCFVCEKLWKIPLTLAVFAKSIAILFYPYQWNGIELSISFNRFALFVSINDTDKTHFICDKSDSQIRRRRELSSIKSWQMNHLENCWKGEKGMRNLFSFRNSSIHRPKTMQRITFPSPPMITGIPEFVSIVLIKLTLLAIALELHFD